MEEFNQFGFEEAMSEQQAKYNAAVERFGGDPLSALPGGDNPLFRYAVVATATLSALSHKVDGEWKEAADAVIKKAPVEVLLGSLVVVNATKGK